MAYLLLTLAQGQRFPVHPLTGNQRKKNEKLNLAHDDALPADV